MCFQRTYKSQKGIVFFKVCLPEQAHHPLACQFDSLRLANLCNDMPSLNQVQFGVNKLVSFKNEAAKLLYIHSY